MVFLEALEAKLPVVSSAMGGALEIVDESCGLLTKPGDPGDLAESLRLLIGSKELRERLGNGGPERVRQLSDPATQMKALQNLSSKVAGMNHS
jgi:glycosyltransferase involved in cell wall biosynthesis